MSTITTTPVPSLDKRPLLIGLGVAGLIAAGVVVAQNVSLPSSTSQSGTAQSVTQVRSGGPDVREAQALSAQERADAAAARLERRAEHGLPLTQSVVGLSAGSVAASVISEQVGGMHRTYAYQGGSQVWSDTFVPPTGNPAWRTLIEKHYGARGGD